MEFMNTQTGTDNGHYVRWKQNERRQVKGKRTLILLGYSTARNRVNLKSRP